MFALPSAGQPAWVPERRFERRSPLVTLAPYMLFLTAGVRFLHYALYGEPLLSLPLFISALIWMIIVGALGYRAMRAKQMATQYSWAYESSGLNWRTKENG